MIRFSSYLKENVDGYYAIELDPTSQNEVLKHGQHEVKSSKHIDEDNWFNFNSLNFLIHL